MSDVIQFTALCNKTNVPVLTQTQQVYVLVELLPGTAMTKVRAPLNFALVLDRSGSMAGEKLRTMKSAVKNIIDQLEPTDILSIVMFESSLQVLVPAQPVTDREALKRKVDSVTDGGGTTMAPGLREGLNQLSRYNTDDRISRLVLLTDGEATDSEDASRREATNAGARGIQIIGLGFGKDWNEDFLIGLADLSMGAQIGSHVGKVDIIQTPDKAVTIFQEVFQSMQIVARDTAVNLRLSQGVEARRVWKVIPEIRDLSAGSIQGRIATIQVGDLEKGGMTYLIEMLVPPRAAGNVRVAQADVTFTAQGLGAQREAMDIVLNFTHDPQLAAQMNGRVMNLVERVQAFKLQTTALSDLNAGDAGRATVRLRQAATILLSQGETELANQLNNEADRLASGGEVSSEGLKTIKLTGSKTRRLTD